MIRLFFLLTSLSVMGCTQAPIMQDYYFEGVGKGAPIQTIENVYGSPYEIRQLDNGNQEYVYIQRINLGRSATDQSEYVFIVNQGHVVDKKCNRSSTSNFQFFH